jgi:glycosyltransferase involved in cell wall biosynthesis
MDGSRSNTIPAAVALHVCTRFQRGGSERRLGDIVRALPELRHHVLLGAESDLELARHQTGAERVWVLPTLVRRVDPARDLVSLVSLWRLLRRRDYSVVVTHQSKAGVLARLAAGVVGDQPAVHSLSMASFGPGYGRLENWVFPRLERALGSRTSAFCVVGDDLSGRFTAIGVPRDRMHVVRSGIPLPARLRARDEARRLLDARHGTVPGRRLVCCVGSLEPRKNPLLLPQLLRDLRDGSADPPDLLVVGDGPERDHLTAELSARGLADHAVLTGHLADPDHVQDVFRGVDLVVLLSEAEGLPQVLVQSAAAGTPFVAFDVEGVREILALGARGSTVPLGRLDGVVDAARRWLRAGPVGGEPRVDLSSWSAESIAASYRAAFGRVLGMVPEPTRELLSASG